MKFTDTADMAGTRVTRDGYLAAEIACARTGCQTYLGTELGLTDERPIVVYRPEEVVFHKDSLATFAGKPITLGHPDEDVSAENWKAHAVGDVGDDIARDGEVVRVGIMVRDAAAIRAIGDGTREISMGYSTPIKMQDGTAPDGTAYEAIQTGPITINHLALVDRARGGSELRIGDNAGKWGVAPLPTADMKGRQMADNLQTVVLGDQAAQVAVADAPKIEAFKADQAKAMADAKAKHDAEIAAKDAEIAKKDAKIEDLEKAAISDADLDAKVQARADLVASAKAIVKDFDAKGMSDADIRKAVVSQKLGDAAVADKAEAYIDARFDILAEDAAKGDVVADAITNGTPTKTTDGWDSVVPMRKEA
ncbi:DUF2213 domain-containing protein [Roseobacter sp. HKCCD9010]|uniref:DUF2213 domain-containing protein n=1 Tax=unclassified Roseobacter TaxID=196798 RepID=UPI0014910CD4|nr:MULTISPECIES: DUF2213 domain-containing protein [unclassified Roseobacter]MBF9050647.1 DUF2213 domain-containing protein [Rhodobacterales bacterium HKCCD4356]NNV11935.1 DUF2213 domain-containing protein [Roseobacter sp. HKCCD7357]NNV16948.1 DUF2213 domain-containing protein [Roseobacter sp. HKCCD8768]NNV26177.1 DUF2213 domain-containing protein [Roseobacter sp. HKCCD8192]NNV30672.1 DUF2213 domain-containing protein [Roseobacter sp. HKCCD9061]